ncbi:peroxisomal sarcosine oxidase-like [Amphiura filiformis]|uniref:peroxisomal sarcosine oxidase-like n=1 Tax=Amphiura filiformis TaxID=82378 RepID=UPI003B211598
MADCLYDISIVGAGLWGSAAAYHLSVAPGIKVCLIGPNEPTFEEFSTRTIYGSYYDEARITRQNTIDPLDGEIAMRTYEGLQQLQAKTGIQFFTERASVYFGPAGSRYIASAKSTSELLGLNYLSQNRDQIRQMYPYLDIGSSNECIIQQSKSGMVNPRKLVLAQKTAARLQGCHILDSIVEQINEKYLPGQGKSLQMILEDGQIIQSRKVLLCTGVFTNFKRLLPQHLQPDLKYMQSQTLRVELRDEDVQMLRNMPTISSLTPEPVTARSDIYACPPVIYPDGKTYLKIGHGDMEYIASHEEVVTWYRSKGNPEMTERLAKQVKSLFPEIQPLSTQIDTCVETDTTTGLPYIDMVSPDIGIAIGGNGVGARLGYEVAKMAANMIRKGYWDHDIPPDRFRARFKKQCNKL